MRVQSARALLSILRFCSELFSLLSGALMGFSTRPTLIMKTVEAASIHPSIAQKPLDSCRARLINGRHSRSLPFGAGRELENSALGHFTLPATSASFGAFLPPGPEVPSRKVAAGGLSALKSQYRLVEAIAFKNARIAWVCRRTNPTNELHPSLNRIPIMRSKHARPTSRAIQESSRKNSHVIPHLQTIQFRSRTLVVLTFQQQFGLRLLLHT